MLSSCSLAVLVEEQEVINAANTAVVIIKSIDYLLDLLLWSICHKALYQFPPSVQAWIAFCCAFPAISCRMETTAPINGTSTTGSMRRSITASTRCLSGCCFSQEFKKPLPHQGQRLEFTFTENYLTCGLSGRINEKPDGDVLPSRPKPAGKAWPWWARGLKTFL